ncbi:DUF3329 domain-containing protein [Butyrivibrio sp. YAB3001]|uniref:DUF3329 domain-containing protein n=1 Tax=Butyrivibrio sp. YAB3001 TaxID=1520812 RepID=UPI0008F63F97|nr:DUF6056 family protein [Butyrivibrio sp. YAB3001]SFC77160.1 hypothetical protein SAMN02910398_03105 [Butyrivibrio sp. YAB3001]
MSKTARKRIFYVMLVICFMAVFVFEYLTPALSDDIVYLDEVQKAAGIKDLFAQEVEHYLHHTGRSVAHIMLRFLLYGRNKIVYDFVAAAVFLTLSVLIYLNVYNRKEYDVRLYGFILAILWFCDPAIGDTVFWEDGACNYLFTATIMTGFVTVYRLGMHEKIKLGKISIVGMFLWGIVSGWCNENTSGGVILFVIIELIAHRFKTGKKSFKPWSISGLVGCLIGFVMLIASPGNYGRVDTMTEEHTGLLAYAARFLKITNVIRDNYFLLLLIAAVIAVVLFYYGDSVKSFTQKYSAFALFIFLFFAVSYVLIAVAYSELRTFFGAFIFLTIGVANGLSQVAEINDKMIQTILTSVAVGIGLFFVLSYFEDGANMARINREFKERDAYFAQLQEQGARDVTAPLLRPEWETRFSSAYRMDIEKDRDYWINHFYATHYNLGTVTGVEREEWTIY